MIIPSDYLTLRGIPDGRFQLRKYPCIRCGGMVPAEPGKVNRVHGYKLCCMRCGRFVGWSGYLLTLNSKLSTILERIDMSNLPGIQQSGEIQAHPPVQGLALAGDPSQNLEAGRKAAKALMDFAAQGGALIKLQGKQYLKAEGWLFLARAFGLTVRVREVKKMTDDPLSFQATAEVLDSHGQVVGQGIGFCGADEKSWRNRPVYALASMAQTRATSKALRSILAWVAVLAGCEGTPGEEIMDAQYVQRPPQPAPAQKPPQPWQGGQAQATPQDPGKGEGITQAQLKKLGACLNKYGCKTREDKLELTNTWLKNQGHAQVKSSTELSKAQAQGLISDLEAGSEEGGAHAAD